MDENERQVLETYEGDIVLPDEVSKGVQEAQEVVGETLDVTGVITSPVVARTIQGTASNIEFPNFVLDLAALDKIFASTVVYIKEFIEDDGDSHLYLRVGNKIQYLGKCDTNNVLIILRDSMGVIFDGKAKLYKDFGSSKQKEVKPYDISDIVLNL